MNFAEILIHVITYGAVLFSGFIIGKISFSRNVERYADAFSDAAKDTAEARPTNKSMILMLTSITSLLYTVNITGLTFLKRNRRSKDEPEHMVNEVMTDLAMCFTHERIEMIEPPVGEEGSERGGR